MKPDITKPSLIPVDGLTPHPKNPRLSLREDVITGICVNLSGGFDPAHALIVRPDGPIFQIISGHHRWEAARRAGLAEVPCWVRDMDDDAAYMALVTSNSQGELSPLEIGMHALHCVALAEGGRGKKGGLSAYAELVGRDNSTISKLVKAATVAENTGNISNVFHDKVFHLSAIHALPTSCWPIAVEAMVKGGWSAAETGAAVKRARDFEEGAHPAYPIDAVIRRHFEYQDFSPATFRKLLAQCRRIQDLIEVAAPEADRAGHLNAFDDWLLAEPRWSLAELSAYERQLEAGFKKAALAADGFKLGDWRDHIGDVTDGSVALLLTDPPYGMDYQSNRRKDKHEKIANDGRVEAADELAACLVAMQPKLAENSHLLVFVDWRNEPALRGVIESAGYKIRGSLVWKKNVHGSGDLRGSFAPMHERIIHAVKGDPALINRVPDVLDSARVQSDRHPTEKPVDLLQQLILATTVEGEMVADPFAGVASTLIAAKRKSRAFWGCEVSLDYHKAGVDRL
jgi:site-specific DNA-methyltransferase (adenine-specific)